MEAARWLRELGWVPHPMEPCLWLPYGPAHGDAVPALCGLLTLHVDDVLGAGNMESATYRVAEAALKQAFQFRTWQKDEPFDCGAKMTRDEDGTWHIGHKEYTSAKFLHSHLKRSATSPADEREGADHASTAARKLAVACCADITTPGSFNFTFEW